MRFGVRSVPGVHISRATDPRIVTDAQVFLICQYIHHSVFVGDDEAHHCPHFRSRNSFTIRGYGQRVADVDADGVRFQDIPDVFVAFGRHCGASGVLGPWVARTRKPLQLYAT